MLLSVCATPLSGCTAMPTVDGAPEIVELDLPAGTVERQFDDAGDLAARVVDIGKPQCAPITLASPLRHLRHTLDCFVGARRVLEQFKPKRKRINAAFARDLVNECLSRWLIVTIKEWR